MHIKIDISNLKDYQKKLKNMKRYDFPLAVRGTLNDAARIMKTEKIQPEFDENFTNRRNFINAYTGYTKSKNTFNLKLMCSKAGVYRGKRNKKIGSDLKKQEFGGSIKDRQVPTASVRQGESYDRAITKGMMYRNFRRGKTGYINKKNVKTVILRTLDGRIVSKRRYGRKGHRNYEWKTLYTKPLNRKIKKSKFIKPAAIKTNKEIPRLFIENAEKRFKKAMK